jgi:hypothetical protein
VIVSALLKLKFTDQVVILDGRIEQFGASQSELAEQFLAKKRSPIFMCSSSPEVRQSDL